MLDAWAYAALCWRPVGIGAGVVWSLDWAQVQALLGLAGLLPLTRETLAGLMWMEEGASEELNRTRGQ